MICVYQNPKYRRINVFSKILRLRFPKTEVQKPIVCYLSKDFDQEKCSVCELCVPVCPTRAMNVRPAASSFSE